jgi:hypothetical protein
MVNEDLVYLTSTTCKHKSPSLAGQVNYAQFDNGGQFIVSKNVLDSLELGKTYSFYLKEIETGEEVSQ